MNDQLNQINGCEVCGGSELVSVLNLGLHPMCDDLVPQSDDRFCNEYPIEILFCEVCKTAHQKFQVPKKELFPQTYHYRSRFTADVLNGMRELVDSCENHIGSLVGKKVIDIGCNDGSLLGFFKNKGAQTFGIEPTGAAKDAELQGHIVYNDFLSESLASEVVRCHGKPDVIVFTNVFAHIENLAEVVKSLQCLMSSQTLLIIENHYLGAVLEGNQFDTFYHEHPRTYSFTSFVYIAQSLGTHISNLEFPARYGGNIRIFMGESSKVDYLNNSSIIQETQTKEKKFLELFYNMQKNIEKWKKSKKRLISELVQKHGKLRAKAFPGRAAILVKLLELDENTILAVHEKPGSMKIGHFLPGTRIPIVSDDELFSSANQSAPLLNLAWHIPAEIRTYLAQHGYHGSVIDIIEQDDFIKQAA
jgi:hypothetical protein